jgi:1,2-diacylglycerol 3-alpha-glucosyltransferase
VLGAFPFPLSQGSQLYARDQARALAGAGAGVTLFCYGSGEGAAPADLDVVRVPGLLSPAALLAGPSAGKPLADAALAARFAAEARRRRFDVALAHNAEAALAALLVRRLTRVPVVYVAHTLLGLELDAYATPALAGVARRAGGALDAALASRADGVLTLCSAAAERLAASARGPLEIVPPGLTPQPPPAADGVERACARCGVEPGRFALYTGNVDRYQDLDTLAEAARLLPELPVVVATHGERRTPPSRLRCVRMPPAESRALTFACALAVLPRRRQGGFPIKLLNYMEAGRAIVARRGVAEGLEHGVSAWLLDRDADAGELARTLAGLAADPVAAARLGRGARARLESHHAWPSLAARTLALAERVARRR